MAKIKCEECGASWDSTQYEKCPYCGSVGNLDKHTTTTKSAGGTTIINNYYGNVPKTEVKTASNINERGEPIGLSEKELKIYYQPRPRVLWLAVLCYVVCVAIIGFIIEEFCDFEEVWVAIVAIVAIVLPVALCLIIVKCLQTRWDKLHKNARALREENSSKN